MPWRRGSTNPLNFVQAVAQVRAVYRKLAPDLVHQVAFWPSIVGSVAAIGLPAKRLSALAGLGFAFTSDTLKARLVRAVLRPFLRHLLGGRRAAVLVQNPDDRTAVAELGIAPTHVFLIPGSGVDTDLLQPLQNRRGRLPRPMSDGCWPTRGCAA